MKTLLENYAPLKNDKKWRSILKQTIEDCSVCHDSKKQMRRTKVTAFRCTKFNESVAMDLTEWFDPLSEKKSILCHLIDEFSRLCSGGIIQNKKLEEVMKCIIENWICKYGKPQKILHDNGGEFVNKKVLKFLDSLEIRSVTTLAPSPFCNGVVERLNAVVKEHMSKMRKESLMRDWNTETIM